MRHYRTLTFTSLIGFVLLAALMANGVFAQNTGDLSIDPGSIKFSENIFIEGKKIRIYATAKNTTEKDLYGIIKFYQNENDQIGTDQPISVFAGKTDDVFVDWTPQAGSAKITVKLIPFDGTGDNQNNNITAKSLFVESDFDRDGIADTADPDDDNDGVPDDEDAFPKNKNEQKDTDGDGMGNNEDTDDDNDGFLDADDALPEDATENNDRDGDGIGDNADPDDDNDGLYDGEEIAKGTDAANPDTDKDQTVDGKDDFPLNPDEQKDTDKDGIGNNKDTDDDNDKISDEKDPFPTNLAPVIEKNGATLLVSPQKEIVFDASTSHDPDGKIQKVVWEIEGEKKEGLIVKQIFEKSGKKEVTVQVTDDAGETVSKTYPVYVTKVKDMIMGLLLLLIIALAIYFGFQYSAKASKKR